METEKTGAIRSKLYEMGCEPNPLENPNFDSYRIWYNGNCEKPWLVEGILEELNMSRFDWEARQSIPLDKPYSM